MAVSLPHKSRHANNTHQISNDDLLRYVEVDLWSRFQRRLLVLVGGFLTIAAVAAILGVPYYIRSQIEQRLERQSSAFTARAGELFQTAHAVSLHTMEYETAREAFFVRQRTLRRRLEGLDQPSKARLITDPRQQLILHLSFMQSPPTLFMLGTTLGSYEKEKFAKSVIAEPAVVVRDSDESGAGSSATIHPVRIGTVEGEISDLRYRIIELEAYRQALDELRNYLQKLGDQPLEILPSEMTTQANTVGFTFPRSPAAIAPSQFTQRYKELRRELAKRLVQHDERRYYDDSSRLYVLIE